MSFFGEEGGKLTEDIIYYKKIKKNGDRVFLTVMGSVGENREDTWSGIAVHISECEGPKIFCLK